MRVNSRKLIDKSASGSPKIAYVIYDAKSVGTWAIGDNGDGQFDDAASYLSTSRHEAVGSTWRLSKPVLVVHKKIALLRGRRPCQACHPLH